MTNKKYVSKPIDTGKNTDTSDLQQIVTSQEFELYRSSTDRHKSSVRTLLIFNRSLLVKRSTSIDLQQIVTSQVFPLYWSSTDRHQSIVPTLYWSSTDRHQSNVRGLLIFNRSSPVKCSNTIDLQQIVTSQVFELYWSSKDRHQSNVRVILIFNSSSPIKCSNSQFIFNRWSPVKCSNSIDLRQIDWKLLELNCHDCLSSMLLH